MGQKLTRYKLTAEYPELGALLHTRCLGGTPLLQKDYGKDMDCTLTSLAFIFGAQHYPMIERIAEKYGYDGDKGGTNPLMICNIMRDILRELHISGTPRHAYWKGVQLSFDKVKDLINSQHYVLLNLWKDGRDYYKNHTVTIIGYLEYEHGKFFVVYDNWNAAQCLVDFDKLGVIASLNWYEVRK